MNNIEKEFEKLNVLQDKIEIVNNLSSIKNSDGSQYFSMDWVKENILGSHWNTKSNTRKSKIKNILKDE